MALTYCPLGKRGGGDGDAEMGDDGEYGDGAALDGDGVSWGGVGTRVVGEGFVTAFHPKHLRPKFFFF